MGGDPTRYDVCLQTLWFRQEWLCGRHRVHPSADWFWLSWWPMQGQVLLILSRRVWKTWIVDGRGRTYEADWNIINMFHLDLCKRSQQHWVIVCFFAVFTLCGKWKWQSLWCTAETPMISHDVCCFSFSCPKQETQKKLQQPHLTTL